MTKLYDIVRKILEMNPSTRDDDKTLVWATWRHLGHVSGGVMEYETFMSKKCPSPDSITRASRKVREDHPELDATENVKRLRNKKESTKGMFIYHEIVQYRDENGVLRETKIDRR